VTLKAFRQALTEAIRLYFADAGLVVTEKRGISLTCRVELSTDALVSVYYNALTGKTSYALIFDGQRVVGYDNYRFWHHHPAETPVQHIPCAEPTPKSAIEELARVYISRIVRS
jgi:hypothetical protein